MKILSFIFALMISSSVLSGETLARNTLALGDETSINEAILALYESELENPTSPLSLEIARINADEVQDSGELTTPNERDIWLISSGRGSYTSFGHTYLLGVPVFWNGSGMIEEYIEYIVVNVSIDFSTDDETGDYAESIVTIVFEKIISIQL